MAHPTVNCELYKILGKSVFQNTGEMTQERAHTLWDVNSHMDAPTSTYIHTHTHTHSTSPGLGAWIIILIFISGAPSFFGDSYQVSPWTAEPEDWSAEAEQSHDTRSHLITGNRGTESDSCHQPVYRWPAKTCVYNFQHTCICSRTAHYSVLRHTWSCMQSFK